MGAIRFPRSAICELRAENCELRSEDCELPLPLVYQLVTDKTPTGLRSWHYLIDL
jgi:hypothetical protein